MIGLMAALWTGSVSSPVFVEMLPNISGVGVRWSVDAFGLDQLVVIITTRNKFDLWYRLRNHEGHRLALFSSWRMRPISGFITRVEPAGAGRLRYVVRGPGAVRMEDEFEQTPYDATTGVSTALASMLTDHVAIASATTDIFANNTQIGGASPNLPVGDYPHEFIRKMLAVSDSSARIYDFRLVDEVFDNTGDLQKWTPVYQPRTLGTAPLWLVWEDDTVDGFNTSRSIEELKTAVTIYYGTINGQMTATNSSRTVLTDANVRNFARLGAKPGDRVANLTSGYGGTVESTATNTITVDGLGGTISGTATGGSATSLVDSGATFDDDGVRVGDYVENTEDLSVTGSATGGSATTCVDTGVDFTTLNIQTGDVLKNTTDGCVGVITTVAATTLTCSAGFGGGTANAFAASDGYEIEIIEGSEARVTAVTATTLTLATLSGGRLNTFTSGDSYKVQRCFVLGDSYALTMINPFHVNAAAAAAGSVDYWARSVAEVVPEMTAEQAAQYAERLIYDAAALTVAPVTISGRTIRDQYMGDWPLWEVIAQGGGFLRLVDLFPDADSSPSLANSSTVFFITSLDYDHGSGTLRIGLDSPDRRLDAQLYRAGILHGTIIHRWDKANRAKQW